MSRWRSAAIERLPEFRQVIAEADNVMSLWLELRLAFEEAYRDPRNDDLIARIYSYADWCRSAPRNSDASRDPLTAVAVAFYEHIPETKAAREDMPRWFEYDEIANCRTVFAYQIGDEAFEELLTCMKKHEERFSTRRRCSKKHKGIK